ncbi:MAG: cell division protein FtsQ/DivIB [Anaerolineae bacterium]
MASVVAPRRRTSLPAAVTTWAGGRIVTLVLLAVSVWALWSLRTGMSWRVQWVEVIGCQFTSAESVAAASGLAGAWSVALQPAEVAQRVEAMPAVLDAHVEIAGPSRVRIIVQEDPPVLTVRAGEQDYWVSAAGRVSDAGVTLPELPVVVVEGQWAPAAAAVLQPGLKALQMAFPEQQEFRYDAARGYVLTSALGCPVYLGDAADLERQMTVLAALEAELRGTGTKPEYISLVSVEGAYYR